MSPVSPGCQAAASVFALTPMTSGCPASVFPSGFAVCQGLAPCGPTSGHGCAPAGGTFQSILSRGRIPRVYEMCKPCSLVAGFRPLRERGLSAHEGNPFFSKRFPVKTERALCHPGYVDTHSYTPWAWNHSQRVRLAITLPDGFWRCVTLRFVRRTRTQKKGPLVAGFRPLRPRLSGVSCD